MTKYKNEIPAQDQEWMREVLRNRFFKRSEIAKILGTSQGNLTNKLEGGASITVIQFERFCALLNQLGELTGHQPQYLNRQLIENQEYTLRLLRYAIKRINEMGASDQDVSKLKNYKKVKSNFERIKAKTNAIRR